MTVLSYQTIERRLIFNPFHSRTKHEKTGLTYGCGAASYDIRLAEDLQIEWDMVALASSMEHFSMPDDVCAVVHDKSSFARVGLFVQNTFIDPGWIGFLTLEISYHCLSSYSMPDIHLLPKTEIHNRQKLYLEAGTPIAQIVLHQLDEPTIMPYRGVYQNQNAGPQGSKFNTETGDREDGQS